MKSLLLIVLLITTNLFASEAEIMRSLQVFDTNNEQLAGAKVELIGTGMVYYTNLKGECYIPNEVMQAASGIRVECISYQSKSIELSKINSKIILDFR